MYMYFKVIMNECRDVQNSKLNHVSWFNQNILSWWRMTVSFKIVLSLYIIFIGLYNLFVLTTNGDLKILRNFNKETFLAGGGKRKFILMF